VRYFKPEPTYGTPTGPTVFIAPEPESPYQACDVDDVPFGMFRPPKRRLSDKVTGGWRPGCCHGR